MPRLMGLSEEQQKELEEALKKNPLPPGAFDGDDETEVVERYVYSTCQLGPGAQGSVRLFVVPLGELLPRLGAAISHASDEAHTNVLRAGQLGGEFGDAAFRSIRVVGEDLAAGVEGRLKLRIGGRLEFESPLAPLLNRERHPFLNGKASLRCHRTDTLEVDIIFDKALDSWQVPTGTAFLRVELAGFFARDVR